MTQTRNPKPESRFKRRLALWLQRFAPLRWVLRMVVTMTVRRHRIGAVGVIVNNQGQVLLAEHVFRPRHPWGLPGGWLKKGEDPAAAVKREIEEELGLKVDVGRLLMCEPQVNVSGVNAMHSLSLAFICKPLNEIETIKSFEILNVKWVDPTAIQQELSPIEQKAIVSAVGEGSGFRVQKKKE